MQINIDSDGVGLALGVEGDGPDLLFVHGLGSAQELWEDMVDGLRDRYRCWTLDLRGHGASDRTPGTYTPQAYASDVAAALHHIGQPTVGIGHSLGGGSLIRVAADGHPELRTVYVIDSTLFRLPRSQTPSAGAFGRILDMLHEFQPAHRPVEDYVAWLGSAPYVGGSTNADAFTPARLRGRAEALSRVDPNAIAETLAGYPSAEPLDPVVSVPYRVVAADPHLGGSFRPEHDEMLLGFTPHADILRLSGVGHQTFMIRGYNRQILDDLDGWLDRVTS